MKRMTEYLKSLVRADTLDSSKSFAMLLSVCIGALIGLCVCFCLVWDVCANGSCCASAASWPEEG